MDGWMNLWDGLITLGPRSSCVTVLFGHVIHCCEKIFELLDKLTYYVTYYGIKGSDNLLFKSYLIKRKQKVFAS